MTSLCAATVSNSILKNYIWYSAISGSSNGTLNVTDSQLINNATGFDLSDITTNLSGCQVKNNSGSGITANDSDITLLHCLFEGNQQDAISTTNGCNLTVERSIIRRNGYSAFNLNGNLTTTIRNCWINKNGTGHDSYYGGAGIYLAGPVQTPLIRNNTIYDNWTYGIQADRYGPDPNVRNCILYSNDTNDFFRESGGDPFTKINFCCLQHPHSGTDNFVANPLFTLNDANDLHIDDDSPCVNAGDPCGVYADEEEIDDEPRNDGRVDVGADENFWSKADYDEDGTVNFHDYPAFANAWKATNAPSISLDDDNDVDYLDLRLFCRDWLWQRGASLGWLQSMTQGDYGSQGLSMMMFAVNDESMITDVPVTPPDALMLTDVQESRALMPERLARRTDAFYAITARKNSAVEQPVSPETIEEMVDWLDEIWNAGDLNGTMTEQDYLEFRQAIESTLEQQ
jgi:hypothetical protein